MTRKIPWICGFAVFFAITGFMSIRTQQFPLERYEDRIDYGDTGASSLALEDLQRYTTEEAVGYAVDALEGRPDLVESAGNVLVMQGRRWELRHGGRSRAEGEASVPHALNPVIERLRSTVQGVHLDRAVRAKAVWVLGELGTRDALEVLEHAAGPDTTWVGREVLVAQQKLGLTSEARRREMLGWRHMTSVYVHGDKSMKPWTPKAEERFKVQ